MMEEEDELARLDFKSPKGQLIKLLEQKIKKVEFDDTLSKVLDQFLQMTREENVYLDNGLFQMNFAEDALLLQSCGQYWAKRVDKLWEDLLGYHTRMVQYDGETAKNCTDSVQKEARQCELARLEERLNRGKRKKISLVDVETDTTHGGVYAIELKRDTNMELFGKDSHFDNGSEEDESSFPPLEDDMELLDEVEKIIKIGRDEEKRNPSQLLSEYHRQKYRLHPREIAYGDEPVWDMNDPDEFNTKEGRLIATHHIRHLFEENDRCLLPDDHFIVAKLRFAYDLKSKWLIRNNIDPSAPYETYKAAYEKYQNDYLENEKRKIQNMPQRNSEDLMKFYKALVKKEQHAIEYRDKLKKLGVTDLPLLSFQTVIVDPVQEGYKGDFDPYIPDDFDEPLEPPAQIPIAEDVEAELCNLFDNFPLVSESSKSQDQHRSDSGYFDGFEADEETVEETNTSFESEQEKNDTTEDTVEPAPTAIDTTGNTTIQENSTTTEEPAAESTDYSFIAKMLDPCCGVKIPTGSAPPILYIMEEPCQSFEEDIDEEPPLDPEKVMQMQTEIRDFVRQGTVDQTMSYGLLKNSYFEQTDDMIMILYDKKKTSTRQTTEVIQTGQCEKESASSRKKKEVIVDKKKVKSDSLMEERKVESKKRATQDTSCDNVPSPKHRKLLEKQVQQLKKGLIKPVDKQKWDNFFSLNYHPEAGEGEVIQVDYESECEDDSSDDNEDAEANDLLEEPEEASPHEVSGYQSGVEPEPSSTVEPLLTQDSGIDSTEEVDGEEVNNNNILELPKETPEEEHVTTNEEGLTPYQIERQNARERVNVWRKFITPKLKELKEQDFNIHEYGSNIINNMQVNEVKPFGKLVEGKSSAEVIRYFISSLQLANTMNVEICDVQQGKLSNDTFQLKLLSTERYHEHLQEYQAPSEETFHERLMKVKEIKMQNKVQSNKSGTKRQYSPATTTIEASSSQTQPRSIMKGSGATTYIKSTPPKRLRIAANSNRIKVLNYSMIRPATQLNLDFSDSGVECCSRGDEFDYQQPSTSRQSVDFDFLQPSTSRQTDSYEHQYQLESPISDVMTSPSFSHTPSRSSIDSGFNTSYDDDFLEQFDQLQHFSDNQLRSTPVKQRKCHM